ncbi:MAG: hypothetical protein KIT43_05425 [Bauldia sp.]|nr:hypothetical protein [Bauldia sp.]MCW5717107.1 hypothetical protein [Bauldia sp.]
MNITARSLIGALLLTVAAGGALAQTGYTRDTVAQSNPFGGLPIDPATFEVTGGSIAALGAASVADLNARCDVVVHWPSYYGWGTAAFCQNVLYAQGLIADPTAPDSSTSGWVTNESDDESGWVTNSS